MAKQYYYFEGEIMGILDIPFKGSYLEYLPLNKIAKYQDGPPRDSVSFTGYPQQHPTEKNKLILVYDPMGENPALLEFKIDDILYVEDVPQAVTEKGEGIPLAKLWIRRGARGMLLEPFEVNESLNFLELRREQEGRFVNRQSGKSTGYPNSARL
jgi:inorganic pyrophosphatase